MSTLADARKAAGMSQREVSSRLRRPVNFSHLVESGQRSLNVCEFIDYAKAIHADPVQLLRRIMT
jgi:transcriptional regulator with XRE-family HTH domain